jgi:hypothetical protein
MGSPNTRLTALDRALTFHADDEISIDELLDTTAAIDQYLDHGTLPAAGEPNATRTPLIGVKWTDDEHIEVWVNGEKVAEASYDEQGTEGLLAVEKTAVAVARAVGVEPTHVAPGEAAA